MCSQLCPLCHSTASGTGGDGDAAGVVNVLSSHHRSRVHAGYLTGNRQPDSICDESSVGGLTRERVSETTPHNAVVVRCVDLGIRHVISIVERNRGSNTEPTNPRLQKFCSAMSLPICLLEPKAVPGLTFLMRNSTTNLEHELWYTS